MYQVWINGSESWPAKYRFASLKAAKEAVRRKKGWRRILLYSFEIPGKPPEQLCYRSLKERANDLEGLYAPRILKVEA